MKWPPSKAWTCSSSFKGYRHFVAINYGGKSDKRWVSLVSVIDSKVSLKVLWKEMNNSDQWVSGWKRILKEESLKTLENDQIKDCQSCLHPSIDSGLLIPSEEINNRAWMENGD